MVEAEGKLTTFFAGRNIREMTSWATWSRKCRNSWPPGRSSRPASLRRSSCPLPRPWCRWSVPEETSRLFKITFQSFVGFLNIVAAQKGVGPLEMTSEKIGDALIVSSQYLPPTKANSQAEAPLQYNTSPTIAFVGDKFIVASTVRWLWRWSRMCRTLAAQTRELTRKLPSMEKRRKPPWPRAACCQNMLEKGHDRAAAEKEVDGLLLLLQKLEGLSLKLAADDSRLQLALELKLADAK